MSEPDICLRLPIPLTESDVAVVHPHQPKSYAIDGDGLHCGTCGAPIHVVAIDGFLTEYTVTEKETR